MVKLLIDHMQIYKLISIVSDHWLFFFWIIGDEVKSVDSSAANISLTEQKALGAVDEGSNPQTH